MMNQFNQQPGMLPHPRQQPTSSEMQLWQQRLMYKRLQELQMQHQLQQHDQGTRQSNLHSQAASYQDVVNQLPAFLNGMPANDASKYMVRNDGQESKISMNPQMFANGNQNSLQSRGSPLFHGSNGVMFSNDHGQAMRSMGFASQHNDNSFYGTPVSSSRGLLEQYSQFQSHNSMKTSMQSAPSSSFHNDQLLHVQACLPDGLSSSVQHYQGENLTGHLTSEHFQQLNNPQLNVRMQDILGREGQVGSSGLLEENAAKTVGPSHGATSLDPTEEKILFGSDDGNWSALLGNALDDQCSGFPSLQSGSWSALMQEAVEASSSDPGFHEEWSGLSLQKTEPSFMKHSAISSNIGMHQDAMNNNIIHNFQDASSSTLRGFPFLNDAAAGSSPGRAAYEHNDRTHTGAFHESSQNNSSYQHVSFPNLTSQMTSRPDGWNKPVTSSSGGILEVHGNDERVHYAQNELNRINNINQDMDNRIPNRQQVDLMKHAAFASFGKTGGESVEKYQHQSNSGQNARESVMSDVVRSPSNTSNSQTSSGFSGWKSVGSRRSSQHQQDVSSAMSLEKVEAAKDASSSQGHFQSDIADTQNQGQGYLRRSQLSGLGVRNTSEKEFPVSASFGKSLAGSAQNTKQSLTSQNMPEYLQMAGESRDISSFPGFVDSNHNTHDGTHGSAGSSGSGYHPQHYLTSAQLAPPRQQLNTSFQQAPDASLRQIQNSKFNLADDTCKQVTGSVAQGNSLSVTASDLPYRIEQLQLQQKQQFLQRQVCSSMSGGESDVNEIVRRASIPRQVPRQVEDSHHQDINQSTQKQLPSMASRVLPFRVPSAAEPVSEFNSTKTESSQLANAGFYHLKTLGEQPSREVGPVLQASAAKNGQGFGYQNENVSLTRMASTNSNMGIHGCSTSSVGMHQNYLLWQQNQAMRCADSDASKMVGKRIKGDFSADASHGYTYAPNTVKNRDLADGELNTASRESSLPDAKMVNYSSKEHDENLGGTSVVGKDNSYQNLVLDDHKVQAQSLSSTSNYTRLTENLQISPQMARSWFENYRKFKNAQILPTNDDLMNAGAAPQQYSAAEVGEQNIQSSQISSQLYSTFPCSRASDGSSPKLSLDTTDHETITGLRKRKFPISETLSWHQLAVQGFQKQQSIGLAEHDWVGAANRLPEKVEEVELAEDVTCVPRARRRIILTTQLMQQLLPSIPATILAAEVSSSYEHVTYFLAKSALGGACSLISVSTNDTCEQLDNEKGTLDKVQKKNKVLFSKLVEEFTERSRKMGSNFLRLDKRTLLADLRLESQDLDRFSCVNRLGKLHGRRADLIQSSSTFQNAALRLPHQRHVTVHQMTENLPEGVKCFSL